MRANARAAMRRRLPDLGLLLATVALAALAWITVNTGFTKLQELRQLERTPRSLASAVLPGEVHLRGIAREGSALLTAPSSRAPTLYYRYEIQRQQTDSEGKRRWVTVNSRHAFVADFFLEDESGRILIQPGGQVTRAEQRHSHRTGDTRVMEYRIDPGDALFIVGHASEQGQQLAVSFEEQGQYRPIISLLGEDSARLGMIGGALFLIWLGTALSSLAVFTACWLLRVHLTAVYLVVLCATIVIGTVHLANSMARDDLHSAYQRLDRDLSAAGDRLQTQLSAAGIHWSGDWSDQLGLQQALDSASLNVEQRQVLGHLRDRVILQIEVTESIGRQWPERVVARGLDLPALPDINQVVRGDDQPSNAPAQRTKLSMLIAFPFMLLGLGLSGRFAWLGFRRIKLKRLIEDLPTTASAGVAYGLTELQGEAALLPGDEPLAGPLTGEPCVIFRYVEEERRGSGTNAHWVTLVDQHKLRRFAIEDREGQFPIDPRGAELLFREPVVRRDGRIRRTEYAFVPGTQVYALGRASIDPKTQSTLVLQQADMKQPVKNRRDKNRAGQPPAGEKPPFILTDLSEQALKVHKARRGFLFLNLAVNGGNGFALAAVGGVGALHGAGFLAAALVPIAYLALFLAILMYNDLVALRQRVRRAWSNIQVSLQKRAELLPNLEKLLKSYLQHERELQTRLTELRSLTGRYDPDLETAGQLLMAEQLLLGRMSMLREAYPELKADSLGSQLMHQLVALENEVALMREGYNNSVERYNIRRQHVPEVLFTRLFKFEQAELFQAELQVRALPPLALEDSQPAKPQEAPKRRRRKLSSD